MSRFDRAFYVILIVWLGAFVAALPMLSGGQ